MFSSDKIQGWLKKTDFEQQCNSDSLSCNNSSNDNSIIVYSRDKQAIKRRGGGVIFSAFLRILRRHTCGRVDGFYLDFIPGAIFTSHIRKGRNQLTALCMLAHWNHSGGIGHTSVLEKHDTFKHICFFHSFVPETFFFLFLAPDPILLFKSNWAVITMESDTYTFCIISPIIRMINVCKLLVFKFLVCSNLNISQFSSAVSIKEIAEIIHMEILFINLFATSLVC